MKMIVRIQFISALKALSVASFLCCLCSTNGDNTKHPSIKIIQTKYGDTYDCVDFYKQPAFDHPMLKSMQLQSSPSTLLEGTRSRTSQTQSTNEGLKDGGCPFGTVPIRRVPKRHLNTRLLEATHSSNISSNALSYPPKGHQYAIVRTKADPTKKFYGTEAHMTIYNPSAKDQRYSAAQMRLRNGPDTIQAGWMIHPEYGKGTSSLLVLNMAKAPYRVAMYKDKERKVNPALFGDLKTRLFVHFTTGQVDCYNTECPGFVQVNTDVPLGYPATKISGPGGQQYSWKISIKKDIKNSRWTVYFGENDTLIGYWPTNIFSNLADSASQAEWGGEVYSPAGVPSPWMGNGNLPRLDTRYAAYFRGITLYDVNFNPLINPEDTEQYVSTGVELYNVQDMGFNSGGWGRVVLYGGEGGAIA